MKYVSPYPAETDVSNYELGARLLGFDPTPQGLEVAGVLAAKRPDGRPLYRDTTIQLARRSTKTTSIQQELLGRCETIPKTKIIQTAQDGTRASEVFTEMIDALEDNDWRDPEDRPWKAFRSTGREYLRWNNGSLWRVVAPKPGSFRSKAADVVWFDESGELDPDDSDRIEAGALPVMDTRPNGQVIRSGTPGEVRAGTFHAGLEVARDKPETFGIVDYHATDAEAAGVDPDVYPEDLIARVHPGVISGLTSHEIIRERFEKMDLPKFLREYLCVWPPDTSRSAIDQALWKASEVDPVSPPEGNHWGAGYDVAIGSSAAATAVAWYDDDDELHLQLMDHRLGSNWLPDDLQRAQAKHPRIPFAYDNIGDNTAVAQACQRKPRFNTRQLYPLALRDVAAATAAIVQHLDAGTLHHATSKSLDAAVRVAVWRESGGSRLFGRVHGKDISALMACVHAVGALSKLPQRRSSGSSSARLEPIAV